MSMTDAELMEALALPETLDGTASEDALTIPEEQRRFIEERRTMLGGTDAAALAGFSAYGTAWSVAAEKKGMLPPWAGNERTELGILFEEPLARVYAKRTGFTTEKPPVIRDREIAYLGAHPDGLVLEQSGGVEIKTVEFGFDRWSREGEPMRVPPGYYVQCQHYMMVTRREWWDLVALFGLSRVRIYRLVRNERVINALRSREVEFWGRFVLGEEMPPMEPGEQAERWLKDRYPAPTSNRIITATQAQTEAVIAWSNARKDRLANEKEEEKWKLNVQAAIGDNEGITANGFTVTWKKNRDSTGLVTDWHALAKHHGITEAQIAQFTSTAITKKGPRVLRVAGEK